MKKITDGIIALIFVMSLVSVCFAESGFSQEDKDRLIRMEATLQVFMQQVDKRFEQVDKRFEELREDMNKRFEQVDKRFDQMMTFLWILAGIFTALVAAVIGFAYWDRRTIIRRAKEEAIEEMKREGVSRSILEVLKEISPDIPRLEEALRRHNLL
jgi:ABC-type lipoprotein release transport system permease subunit